VTSVRFPLSKRFFKLLFLSVFFLLFSVFANASCVIPGTESSCGELISELPWSFSIEQKEGANRRIFFESQGGTGKGGVHLKMILDISTYRSKKATIDSFVQVLNKADPDMGLTYGWDFIIIQETRLYHLHADCSLSESNFMVMVRVLERILGLSSNHKPPALLCRCGGGCKDSELQTD